MVTVAVAFDGTRVSEAESATDGGTWDKWGATQAPSVEPDIVWQFGSANSDLSNKVGTVAGGVEMDQSTSTYDFTTGHASGKEQVAMVKFTCVNSAALNVLGTTGAIAYLGHTNGDYWHWHAQGSDTYPAKGGWVFEVFNPNITGYRDGSTGTPTALTAIDYWGISADFTATSKSENVVMSAIDFWPEGEGLTLTGGDGASADGVFDDFPIFDEDDASARYALATRIPGGFEVRAVLNIGSSTATVMTDSDPLIIFLDTKTNNGAVGLNFSLENASNVHTIDGGVIKGLGTKAGTTDTRPVHKITGSTDGAGLTWTGATWQTFTSWTLNAKCDLSNSKFKDFDEIDCGDGATLVGSVIENPSTDADSSCIIWNATVDPDGYLDDMAITSHATTAHHAIEFGASALQTNTLTNIDFTDFTNTIGNSDTPLYFADTGGDVAWTVNAVGCSGITADGYKKARVGDTVSIVIDPVTVQVTTLDGDGVVLGSCPVFVAAASGGVLPSIHSTTKRPNTSVTLTRSGVTATATFGAAHNLLDGDLLWVESDTYLPYRGVYTTTWVSTTVVTYTMASDPGASDNGDAAFVFLKGTSHASTGILSMSRTFAGTEFAEGWARKASGAPYYKNGGISGSVSASTGLETTARLPDDQ